jgi:hypothetical protein
MSGNGAYPSEMDFSHPEIAGFTRALQATLLREPDPAASTEMVRRLAAEARISSANRPTAPIAARSRFSARRRLAAVALAVLALPLLGAGLAVAGVKLPAGAADAFQAVGVDLPNQESSGSDDPSDADKGKGNDGAPAASPAAEPGSDKAVKGDKRQGNGPPSHSNAGGNENPGSGSGSGSGSNGKAKGKPPAPPGQSGVPPPKSNAGGNGKGNAGGNSGSAPGQANEPAGSGGSGSGGGQGQGQGSGKPPKA